MTNSAETDVAVGFLAGGQGRRMGGTDKALLKIGGKTILERQLQKTSSFPVRMINANGDLSRYAEFGLPVVSDSQTGFLGPLAGILSCLEYLSTYHTHIAFLASIATDAPFIPDELPRLLYTEQKRNGGDIVQAGSLGRRHPVFSLWPVSLKDQLEQALVTDGIRKIDDFTDRFQTSVLMFDDIEPDPFLNLNTQTDIRDAQRFVT